LVAIVHFVGDIRPPQEGVDMRSAIVEAGAQFDERRTGTQADAVHALEAVERVVLGHPDGEHSPTLVLDADIGGHEGARTMVLRPVELDASRNPRPGEADERRLDHLLAIEEIIIGIGLVLADEDAPADFRQHDEADEIVFQQR
jgi:hypothetical protein